MNSPIITNELDLYHWLLGYMRRDERVRLYPKPLVELTRYLHEAMPIEDIWESELLERHFQAEELCPCCGQHVLGALQHLFEQMGDTTEQLPCSSGMVALTAEILRLFPDPVELRDVNDAADRVLGLTRQGLLTRSKENDAEWLKTTPKGQRKLKARIEVKRDERAWIAA